MSHRMRTLAAAATLTIGLGAGAVALADTATAQGDGQGLEAARARCLTGIDERLSALDRLATTVASAEHLTDTHDGVLTPIVADTSARLTGLRPQVEAATTAAELRTPCASAVNDNRVYRLVEPQVHLTVGSDAIEAGAALVDEAVVRLDTAIARAADAGLDVTEAQAHRDAAAAAGDAAATAVAGQADAVLALHPADIVRDTPHPTIESARDAVAQGRDDLRTARTEAQAAVDALR